MQSKLVTTDIKSYEKNGFDGLIACGTQRTFFPSGLSFYTYASTLYDTSLSCEEIEEDYFSHLYGEDWKKFREYFAKISDALPFEFFSRDRAFFRENGHFDAERSKKIAEIKYITAEGIDKILRKTKCQSSGSCFEIIKIPCGFL